MSEDELGVVAAYFLNKYLDRHWQFKLEDRLYTPDGTPLAGHTSWDHRLIQMSRMYVLEYNAYQLEQLFTHEVAHALTPEDWVHGEIFQAKLEEIRRNEDRTQHPGGSLRLRVRIADDLPRAGHG